VTQPTVVLILIDDMGWKDLVCYGSSFYETPNIDRLAREGMRFTDGYAACPVCSPTRASIMTGKYPVRLALNPMVSGVGGDEARYASGQWWVLDGGLSAQIQQMRVRGNDTVK